MGIKIQTMKVLQELKLAYITGLSKEAAAFIRKEAFARRDDSGDPENDIYCMEGFAEDVYGGHTAVPENLAEEINKLILLCQDNGYIWIGIS